jgi:hypothetical protein
MSYGFRAINSNGSVQIDQRFRNYKVWASGTVSNNYSTPNWVTFDITYASNPSAIVFIKWNTLGKSLYFGAKTNTGQRFLMYPDDGFGFFGAFAYDYVVLAPNLDGTPSSDTWGMRIRDAAGNIAFDSGIAYPKLKYMQKFQYYNFSGAIKTTGVATTDYICSPPHFPWYDWINLISPNYFGFNVRGSYITRDASGGVFASYRDQRVHTNSSNAGWTDWQNYYKDLFPGGPTFYTASIVAPPANHYDTLLALSSSYL